MPPKKSRGSKRNREAEESSADEGGALLSVDNHGRGAEVESEGHEVPAARSSSPKGGKKGASASQKSAARASQASSKKSGGRKSQNADPEESVAEHPLLELLCSGAAMATTVDDLISLYKSDKSAAVAVMITTVCRASGAPGTVTVDRDVIADKSNILSTLEEVFARVPVEGAGAMTYLLINKDTKYRRFKKTFPEFFEKFVTTASDSILDDDFLLDILTNWLSAMGESKARSFRHTASTAMIAILNGLAERLHAAAEALSLGRSKKELASLQLKKDRVQTHFDEVFKYSVQPRSKDVAPEIRLNVLAALRSWITSYPEIFLENKRLIYFVDALFDKRPDVRAEVLETFVTLLGVSSEHIEKLQDFLVKYAARIAEMAADLDTRVANLALKLCAMIINAEWEVGGQDDGGLRGGKNILSNDNIDNVLLGLMDDRQAIRTTSGTLLKVFIRCRTGGEDQSELDSINQRSEVLAQFATTLRREFGEPWAERYLVDAIWSDQHPPQLLTEFKPFVHLAVTTRDGAQCASLLRLLAAIMERLQGPLQFGPAAKDDLKPDAAAKRAGINKDFDAAELRKKISNELVSNLGKIDFSTSDEISDGVCAIIRSLDLSVLSQDRIAIRFKDIITGLVKISLSSNSKKLLKNLVEVWGLLAFGQHPQKTAAENGLQDVVSQTLKQLNKLDKSSSTKRGAAMMEANSEQEKEHLYVWQRVSAVTYLLALTDQLPVYRHSLSKHIDNGASPALLQTIADACYYTVLWYVGQAQNDKSISDDDVGNTIGEIVSLFLKVAARDSEATGVEHHQLRVSALTYICDLVGLPQAQLPQGEQAMLLKHLGEVSDGCNSIVEYSHQRLRENLKLVGTGALSRRTQHVTSCRKLVSDWEGRVTNLASGICRLYTYKKMDETTAPQALLQWTRVNVKQAADLYKGLFHTIRDRATNAAELEQQMIEAALKECKEVGGNSNPQGMEAFFSLGQKLSTLHFVPNDKHYPDVVSAVKWGMEYAATMDPLVLHAVTPYCSRLKVPDALSIANSVANSDFFGTISSDSTSGADVCARSFIGGLRRAAKLEDAASRGVSRVGVTPGAGITGRTTGRRTAQKAEEDGMLAGVLAASNNKLSGGTSQKEKNQKVVHNDGWRSRGGGAAAAVPSSLKAGSTQMPASATQQSAGGRSTQKTTQGGVSYATTQGAESEAISTLAGLDSENFIATQEWN